MLYTVYWDDIFITQRGDMSRYIHSLQSYGKTRVRRTRATSSITGLYQHRGNQIAGTTGVL